MKFQVVLFVAIFVAISAKSVFKRDNSYGDEPNHPAAAPAESQPVSTPLEQPSAAIEQAPVASRNVQSSGYRKKRDNKYGDEPVQPSSSNTQSLPSFAPVEQPSAAIEQAPVAARSSQSSGYRKKRDNSYGDEPVKPANSPAVPEPAVIPVEQPSAAIEQAPVAARNSQSSGYRKKRESKQD
uniref:Uncharacterized protein n=1 Tax=Panagrolaimus sp. JU765 TaxID=591449 RepID=A0AC34RRL7_9BILA